MLETILIVLAVAGIAAGASLLYSVPECRKDIREDITVSELPRLSIIIPARNEEDNIAALLESIASSKADSALPHEVIVVDDGSTDKTAQCARGYHATVIQPSEPPQGWAGKTWACMQGAQHATGDIFLFLDADTRFEPEGLSRIYYNEFMEREGVLSIAPYHKTKYAHEQFSAFFNIVMAGSMGAFSLWGNPDNATGLFGPFLMVHRDDYFAIGGHESVKGEILEHYFMAEPFRQHGITLHCRGGRGIVSYRMYPHSLSELAAGWAKAFASGSGSAGALTMLMVSFWFDGIIAVLAGVSLALAQAGTSGNYDSIFHLSSPAAMVGCYLLYVIQTGWMLGRLGRFKWYTSLLFPLPFFFFLGVFAWSALISAMGGTVKWKGRNVASSGRNGGLFDDN